VASISIVQRGQGFFFYFFWGGRGHFFPLVIFSTRKPGGDNMICLAWYLVGAREREVMQPFFSILGIEQSASWKE